MDEEINRNHCMKSENEQDEEDIDMEDFQGLGDSVSADDTDGDVVILSDDPSDETINTPVPQIINIADNEYSHNNLPQQQHNKTHDVPDCVAAEPVPANLVAAERKRMGNEYFTKSEYHQAYKMYTMAIEIIPTEAAYFGNRSACLLMMHKFKEAAEDAKTALNLDPNLKNGYVRLVRATLALGDITQCESAFDAASKKPELNFDFSDEKRKLSTLKQLKEDIKTSVTRKDFRKVLYLTERAKEIAVGDFTLKITKADALIKLGRFNEAQDQCTEILQTEGMSMEACILRAYCFYQADNLDKALQYYRQALQLAPDNREAQSYYKKIKQIKEMRELGAAKFKVQNWIESQEAYKKCLSIVRENEQGNAILESKLNFNLALVSNKNDANASLTYVNKAIELNSSYVKAILHRASIYMTQEKYDEAVKDFESAEKLEPSTKDIRRLIDNARLLAKRAKRKDYYKILGIDKQASADEIKKAYKKRALVHHPDRHANATELERKDQERKFKEVLEAYEVLLDDKKRRRYDSGLDINESMSSPNYEAFDASQLFGHMFFSQGRAGGCPNSFHQSHFPRQGGYSSFRR